MKNYCIYITNNLNHEYINNNINYLKTNNFIVIKINTINNIKKELLNIHNKNSCILILDSNFIIINTNLLTYCNIVFNNEIIMFYSKNIFIPCFMHYNKIHSYINFIDKKYINLKYKTIINENIINYLNCSLFGIFNPFVCNQYSYKIPIIQIKLYKYLETNNIQKKFLELNYSINSLNLEWDKIINIDQFKKNNLHYNNKTILIYKSHIKDYTKIKINNNNINKLNINLFDIVIIVYSGIDYLINSHHKNIVYIKDHKNIGLDFGKDLLAYEYLKKNNITNDIIFLVNDSIVITNTIHNLLNNIFNKINYCSFIGLINNKQIKEHFQSWFLILRKTCFDFKCNYYNKNDFNKNKNELIYKYEVNLCRILTNKFEYNYIYKIKSDKNIMYDVDTEYIELYKNQFKFVKLNRIKNIPKRPKLNYIIIQDINKLNIF